MKANGELFAIKEIRKSQIRSKSHESRVIAERNILTQTSHQFLTKLHYAFQTSTKLYFVLEFVGGGNLRFHITRGIQFSHQQIRLYLAQIVIALRTLHKLGIIYRDLKPENILIDKNGHLKLSDFGLASQMDCDLSYSFCGTRSYLSPEVLRGEKHTFAIDWWSLGIVAFELRFGYRPFENENTRRLYETVQNTAPRIPRNADPTIASFIRQLLVKDPQLRLSGTDVICHPYFAGLSWEKVAKMEFEPEFIPIIDRPDSVLNFDKQYTTQPLSTVHSEPDSSVVIPDFYFENDDAIKPVITFDDLHCFSSEVMSRSCQEEELTKGAA
jgi:serine/threonine protein kinase